MDIFNNIPKMRKICNIIVAFLFTFSIFTFSVMYASQNRQDTFADSTYESEVDSANKYNQLITKPKTDSYEESIFANGIDAFLTAWDNYNNASSFTITGLSTSYAYPPMVGEYIVLASVRAGKWQDGYTFQELHKYQLQGSTSFVDMNEGSQTYTSDTQRFYRSTKNGISYNSSTKYVSAKYYNDFILESEYQKCTPICYILNKDTINQCTYFRVNRLPNGKIINYEVELKLNPKTSVKGYDEAMQRGGQLDSVPEFDSVTISAKIDTNGYFISISVDETYTLKKTLSIKTRNVIEYNISGYNETPSIERLF